MSQLSTRLYEFGAFRLDAVERVLWRGEELIVLPPKVFDTLWMLVKREGNVVSKSELMEAIWPGTFVEESNLSQNIYTLRRTLGVDEQGRQFIETVPRRGYRFAVPIRLIGATTETPSAPSPLPDVRPGAPFRHLYLASLGILVLAALSFGIYQYLIRRGEKEKIAPIEQLRFQSLTDSGDVVFPTISPNGELLVYVRLEEQQGSLWVRQLATGKTFQTLPPSRKSYRSLTFSPDGKYLFFREESDPGAIYQTPVYGGSPKKVAQNVWSDFSVSPDGKQFAFVRRDAGQNAHQLILSTIASGSERVLSVRESSLAYRAVAPAWSPDSSTIVMAAGSESSGFANLLSVDVSTGKEKELKTPRWRTIWRILWTPDGKHLIFSARATGEPYPQLWTLAYLEGEVRRLTNDLEGYFWLSLSADGRILVTRQQRIFSQSWLVPGADAKKARQLTFGRRNLDGYVGLAWTADDKIVFSAFENNSTDLYSINPDGSNRVQLTANAGTDNEFPSISQDGRYIVFTSNRTGAKQIWRMDIDGRNPKQLTFGEEQNVSGQYAAITPDVTEVFFIKRGVGPATISKVSIDGGPSYPISRLIDATAEGFLSISGDGRWLSYQHVSARQEVRSEERTMSIGVLPASGGAESRLFDLSMRRPITQWSEDSAAFDYVAGSFNSSSLWRQPISGGEPQKLCDFPDRIFNLAWSRDRKNLVVSRGKLQGDAILITNLP